MQAEESRRDAEQEGNRDSLFRLSSIDLPPLLYPTKADFPQF